jgi:hypothetical protein
MGLQLMGLGGSSRSIRGKPIHYLSLFGTRFDAPRFSIAWASIHSFLQSVLNHRRLLYLDIRRRAVQARHGMSGIVPSQIVESFLGLHPRGGPLLPRIISKSQYFPHAPLCNCFISGLQIHSACILEAGGSLAPQVKKQYLLHPPRKNTQHILFCYRDP